MVDDGYAPASVADATLALYADNYFEYDSARRATKEKVAGGTQQYTFAYTTQSPTQSDYNQWRQRTVETRPDGSQNIVYTSRASWCGQLKLGTLCVPVKAYPAIATPPEIPLRQLYAVCGQRIEYRKCCPTHGEVPAEEIIKGYPYQPDQYVRLSALNGP